MLAVVGQSCGTEHMHQVCLNTYESVFCREGEGSVLVVHYTLKTEGSG